MHRYMSDFCEHSENLNKKSDKIFASAPTVTDSAYKQRIRLILAQCILFNAAVKVTARTYGQSMYTYVSG